jgi:phage shock protein A
MDAIREATADDAEKYLKLLSDERADLQKRRTNLEECYADFDEAVEQLEGWKTDYEEKMEKLREEEHLVNSGKFFWLEYITIMMLTLTRSRTAKRRRIR